MQTSFYTDQLLDRPAFTQTHFYTNSLFHKPPFTPTNQPTSSYTMELLHKPASTQSNFLTNQLLHKPPFAPTNFYKPASTRSFLSTSQPFAPTSFNQPLLWACRPKAIWPVECRRLLNLACVPQIVKVILNTSNLRKKALLFNFSRYLNYWAKVSGKRKQI